MVYFGHVMGGSTGWWGREMESSGTRRAGPNRGPVESTPGLGPDNCLSRGNVRGFCALDAQLPRDHTCIGRSDHLQ